LEIIVSPNRAYFTDVDVSIEVEECVALCGPNDFAPESIEPKVFCGWKKHDKPRSKVIQERSKLYLSMNLQKLLEERGVPLGDERKIGSMLPLGAFDDESYETYSPEKWMEKGRTNKNSTIDDGVQRIRIPGLALRRRPSDDAKWVEVRVTGYIAGEPDPYILHFCDDGEVGRVSRLDLMFFAEDPRVFADRIVNAINERAALDNSIRYDLYINCMPTNEANPNPESDPNRS